MKGIWFTITIYTIEILRRKLLLEEVLGCQEWWTIPQVVPEG